MQVDRLMHVVLDLLMCKTVELLASQKSIFSIFPVMKGLNKSKKKKKKKCKNHSKPPKLVIQSLFK